MKGETTDDAPSAAPAGLSAVGALVRRHDRDRYQTALFAPAPAREVLFALYAFNAEIARVRERVSEPVLGQIRLQWWREVIAAAYGGEAPRAHVVAAPLTAAIRERDLPRAPFERLVDARERDLDEAPFASLAALEEYAEGTSSALLALALAALGVSDPAAAAAARRVGIGYALAGLLRAMPFHAAAGRSYVPADIAARTGFDPANRAVGSAARRAAVAELAAAAGDHLRAARAKRRAVPRAALPALLPAVVAQRSLTRLARAGHDPFAPALQAPDPLQSWRLAAAMLRRRF